MDSQEIKKFIYHHDSLANLYNIYRNWNRNKHNWMSDEQFVKWQFHRATGRELNLENPKTYDDKTAYLKIHNNDTLLTRCSDKVAVRDYVRECGLGDILNEVYGVYDSVEAIEWDKLPDKCMIKCNHTSGANILFDRKKGFDYKYFKNEFSFWMKRNYYWTGRERNYIGIKPLIICEKYLEQGNKDSLNDYRFMCFHGNVKLVFGEVGASRPDGTHNTDFGRNVYNRDFELLEGVQFSRKNFAPELLPKPINYNKMVKYAEILSKPFIHARVDFYNIDGQIYFGEITFYHQSCCNTVTPEKLYYEAGSWIDLSKMK